MRYILVINDHSKAANHAAKFALSIARNVRANLLILNAAIPVNILPDVEYEFFPESGQDDYTELQDAPLAAQLLRQNPAGKKFRPEIVDIDPTLFSADELMPFIQLQDIWMLVKGIPGEKAFPRHCAESIQAILKKVKCPMLLVPEREGIKLLSVWYIALTCATANKEPELPDRTGNTLSGQSFVRKYLHERLAAYGKELSFSSNRSKKKTWKRCTMY